MQPTDKDKMNVVFLRGELKAFHDGEITIERLLVLKMELDEMHKRITEFIDVQKEPPIDGI